MPDGEPPFCGPLLRSAAIGANAKHALLRYVGLHWRIKGLIQKSLSAIPFGTSVNTQLQLLMGELRNFEGSVESKFRKDWIVLLHYLDRLDWNAQGKELLEVGSGWIPTFPICFRLAGAERVHTFDIYRHMREDLSRRMVRTLEPWLEEIALACGRPAAEVERVYRQLRDCTTLSQLLSKAAITYHAPGDAAATNLPPGSVDLVFSNSVLEHIPGPVIEAIMRESRRVLRPGGIAAHCVACNDHYASFDREISFVNFLRFSESEWRMWNNTLLYQNRLRAPDFLRFAEQAGLELVLQERNVRPGTMEALQKLPVAQCFRHYNVEDLAATTMDFVVRSPGN